MYIPASMREDDIERVRSIIAEFPFATLVTPGDTLHISHVPLMAVGESGPLTELRGHLAAANPHARALDGRTTTAIFNGPHGYISPAWYTSPDQVPTWNYVAVHVTGVAHCERDPARATELIEAQVAHFEGAGGWRAEPESIANKIAGLTVFTLEVAKVEAKLKLGQNRELVDRRSARANLERRGQPADVELARWMGSTEPRD